MKKTIEKYYCDICGEEKDIDELKTRNILTYSTNSSTDGAPYNPSVMDTNVLFFSVEVDLCYECAKKIAVVKDVGVQENKYEYTGGFTGEKKGNKF